MFAVDFHANQRAAIVQPLLERIKSGLHGRLADVGNDKDPLHGGECSGGPWDWEAESREPGRQGVRVFPGTPTSSSALM